jgi:predicted  nucleic acid-binding Zn-ribbon protein
MGHRGGLQHKYDKPEVEELLEEYIKAIDLLTINDENRLKAKVATLEDKDKMIQELSMTLEGLQGQVHSKDKELQDLKKIVERLHNASIFIKATDLPEWKAKAVSLDKFTEDMRTLDEMEKVIKEQVLERAKRLEVIKEQLLEDEKALAAFEEQQKQYKVASKKQKK